MECPIEIVDNKLLLPEVLKNWLKQGEGVVGYLEGDAFILKRKRSGTVSKIAQEGEIIPEPSLEELADEVHLHREEKRRAGGV